MLIRHRDHEPVIDPSAYIAPTAVVVGNVHIGPRARVMYGAVLDSEGSRIEIGECAIIGENAVVRATAAGDVEHPVVVGDHAFISPHATLLGCAVGSCAYVATGVTVLQGAVIGDGGSVAVGALVHATTVVPPAFFIPPNAIAIGDPITLFSPDQMEEVAAAIKAVGFARTAFGVQAQWEDRAARYRQATEVRSAEFASHADDVILDK